MLRSRGTKALLVGGIISTDKSYPVRFERTKQSEQTDIRLLVKSGWNSVDSLETGETLAVRLKSEKLAAKFYGVMDSDSLHQLMIRELVKYLGKLRNSPEIDAQGAIIAAYNNQANLELIHAGSYRESCLDLSRIIAPQERKTQYYAWGDEEKSTEKGIPFLAEFAITLPAGDDTFAEQWSSTIGMPEIPFSKQLRTELIQKLSSIGDIGNRIAKWRRIK
jgi:hypothetical protein